MKRILLFLVAATLATVSRAAVGDTFTYEGLIFVVTSETDHTVMVSGNKDVTGDILIPSYVDYESFRYTVTSIGKYAFNGWCGPTSVTIPNTVTSIENAAFYSCSNLMEIVVENDNPNYASNNGVLFNVDKTELIRCPGGKQGEYTIPNSVTSIGEAAFDGCYSLTEIEIPNSVTSIGNEAFSECSGLTSVLIPNSVTEIGYYAFDYCIGLTLVTIPNSVTEIGQFAFYRCTGLTEIVVENGNLKYVSENGVLFNAYKTKLIVCPGGKTGEYTIPNSVFSIEVDAFAYCSGLTSVTIPNSVTSIEVGTFEGCSGLTSVEIPNSVSSIGEYAFVRCSSLTSVEIPNSVTEIGGWAFSGCSSLTSVEIPNSVTSIGGYAFEDCSSLTSVTIPNSVTSIGGYAFEDCSSLTSVTIPNSVTSIGGWAFYACSGLTEIVVENGNPKYVSENGVLFNADKTELIVCPGGKTGEYTIPNSVASIVEYAFYDCRGLTSVTISNSVTTILYGTFWGCSGLTSVTIPNSVTSIEDYTFWGCSSLKRIYDLNPTPQTLGKGVFAGVPDDAVVYIPKGSFSDYFVATGWAKFTDFREIGVFDMALSEMDLHLTVGSTATVAATVTKDDEVTVTSEEWSSSNPEVATVDNGVITAVAAGEAVIYFTVVDGYGLRHIESCAVTVSEASGVDSVVTDTADAIDYSLPVKVYNLQGVMVADCMDSLPAGIYIVRQGKNVRKVAVR